MVDPFRKKLSFCIIGGGLTGTAMLCQFVSALQDASRRKESLSKTIEIHVIERNRTFGPGFPHSDKYAMPCHLLNMCARDMSILFEEPNDFQSWVNRNAHQLKERFPILKETLGLMEDPDLGCNHYPRPVMGEYLKFSFNKAVVNAEALGAEVRLFPCHEVKNLWEEKTGRVRVEAKNLKLSKKITLLADRVLLATGHWFERKNDTAYFASPWPAKSLQTQIPEGANVAIIGTSLSAIDAVITLTADGDFSGSGSGELIFHPSRKPRHLYLYSRRALLPAVRGRNGPYQNRYLTPGNIENLMVQKGALTLEDLFALFNEDLERAYGHPFPWKNIIDPAGTVLERLKKHIHDAEYGDGPVGELLWQTVLQQVFPMVRKLYQTLSQKERLKFERNYSTLFFTHAAPMPMINALKLSALMQSGIVEVRQLMGNPPNEKKGDLFSFVFKGSKGERMTGSHPFVVDARGQNRFYDRNPEALAVNLLKSGTVEIEPLARNFPGEKSRDKAEHDSKTQFGGTGSLWVDPDTHRILRTGEDGKTITSNALYAVGTMTRGQIIDASMAHGSAVSTYGIAQDWITRISTGTFTG
jgi:uncharacterized NAD(P)/FAD-binding protein YdhS